MAVKPLYLTPSTTPNAGDDYSADDVYDDDDWRKFFDDHSKRDTNKKAPSARLHKLTIHESLHSLHSHRAVFTRAWLVLLPHLSTDQHLASRALSVMHRGVLPHLTRPVLAMDWVGACVDLGKLLLHLILTLLMTSGGRGDSWSPCAQRSICIDQRIQPVRDVSSP